MAEVKKGRRQSLDLEKVDITSNAALWLDKYMESHKGDKSKKKLVKEVSEGIPTPKEYDAFFKRWKESLTKKCEVIPKEAKVQSRLAIGLGAESVLETSVTLHRTYGTPYIPGSALKGLAAHYARNYLDEKDWGTKSKAYQELFGTTDKSGCVDFYDALYIPDTGYSNEGKKQALWADIITVHHPKYYQGDEQAPADWDSPTPIPFLTATGRYLIALGGEKEWVETTYEILGHALHQLGIGAKTSSGYGRMDLEGYEPPTTEGNKKKNISYEEKDIEELKGIVLWYSSGQKKGIIRDIESKEEYPFTWESIIKKGWTPPKKEKVSFSILSGTKTVIKVKKRFS